MVRNVGIYGYCAGEMPRVTDHFACNNTPWGPTDFNPRNISSKVTFYLLTCLSFCCFMEF
jgi:hypothetical protein